MYKRTSILLAFILPLIISSCQKQGIQTVHYGNRTIKFILYTNKDFSNDKDTIKFSLTIRNQEQTFAFDSALTAMRVKDIPNPTNKWTFTKTIPNDGTILIAGFNYYIKNVGYSWFLDTVGVNQQVKTIEYPFQ
ncbi:hypothetical protein GCM10027049_11580 [Mucilaginibacter puniceus]